MNDETTAVIGAPAAEIHDAVRQHYGRIAEQFDPAAEAGCGCGDDCCGDGGGLYQVDLQQLPAEVTGLSLGCGDPIALASLRPAETVLDLGSGGGIDCFLAAERVGPAGRVIGVDMTAAMIARAERNRAKVGGDNVEFRLGQIEVLPVDDASVDVIISNCVINLSPDKTAVFREAFRVLRPGGRLAISDVVTQGRFSPAARADLNAWAGCVTGAEDLGDYVAAIEAAGFTAISVRDKNLPDMELAGTEGLYIGRPRVFSARVTAVKPA